MNTYIYVEPWLAKQLQMDLCENLAFSFSYNSRIVLYLVEMWTESQKDWIRMLYAEFAECRVPCTCVTL